jgi:LemA protein
VRTFPASLVASFRGFREKPFFEATPGSEAAPQIKF